MARAHAPFGAIVHAMRVVYYAHHHGSGHRRHAERFARLGVAETTIVGTDVRSHATMAADGAGAGPDGAGQVAGTTTYVDLPPDDESGHVQDPASLLHWTPSTPGIRRRFRVLHDVLASQDPDVVLVDVSVEAALFALLAGYRVAFRRMPGRRDDPAHRMAYHESAASFAYYPAHLESPSYTRAFGDRTHYLALPDTGRPAAHATHRRGGGAAGDGATPGEVAPEDVLVLTGFGGSGVPLASLAAAARAVPGRRWHVLGEASGAGARQVRARVPDNLVVHGRVDEVGPWLARAAVVVTAAGTNTTTEVAAARRPTILVPEDRPFEEQRVWAQALHRAHGTVVADGWRGDHEWPALLERAQQVGGEGLGRALLVPPEEFRARVIRLLGAIAEGPGGGAMRP